MGPDGDRLVFMRRVAGNMDIYVKHLGSGNVTRLTDSRAFDEFPEFSPNGTTVAFGSNRSGSYDIWTKNVQTGQLRRITTDPHADSYPSFSPDGSKITFQSTRGGNLDIWVKDLSSGQTTQVTGSSVGERYPTWSPDGARIAFTRTQNGTANVWTVNVNADRRPGRVDDQQAGVRRSGMAADLAGSALGRRLGQRGLDNPAEGLQRRRVQPLPLAAVDRRPRGLAGPRAADGHIRLEPAHQQQPPGHCQLLADRERLGAGDRTAVSDATSNSPRNWRWEISSEA